MRSPRRSVAAVGLAAALALASLGTAPAAWAGNANAGIHGAPAGNPIAGLPWGVYTGANSGLYPAYARAKGRDRQLLANLALKPITQMLGFWDPISGVGQAAKQMIAATTGGDPKVLSQLSTFALNPWEGNACSASWSVSGGEAWYRALASAIGSARTFVIVQVDSPFMLCTPSSAPETITAYGAERLAALTHTTVYLDAGAAAWEPAGAMAGLLIRSGIRHVRGFALNDTQYGATSVELGYGAAILSALGARGVRGKHFIVNTDQNGQPYLAGQVSGGSNYTPRCSRPGQTLCQRTGIPPTTDVTNVRWHLPASAARIARRDVDAYVWSADPWDVNGGPFSLTFALELGANGEY
jgi:endoglucanase